MSLEEIRERNKMTVTDKALTCFIENGIEGTKIKDIARAAELTERSVYRYFETKADIVQAAAYLYWDKWTQEAAKFAFDSGISKMPGIEQIRTLLGFYSNMYFESPRGVLFTIEAEMYLFSAGKGSPVMNRPPYPFETSDSPLVTAIHKGLEDGSVNRSADVKELYYNAFDSILSVMQKLAMETASAAVLDSRSRMNHLCELFVRALQG